MASEETFIFTKCKTYTFRLYILLQDIGSPVLRDLIRWLIGEVELKDYLLNNKDYLKRLKIVSNKQFSTLFPRGNAAVSLEDFDISLLMVLLQSVCSLSESSSSIWTSWPADADQSLEANITRLRVCRNTIFHQPNTDFIVNIPGNSEERYFNYVWNTIKKAILVLDGNSSPNLESRIDGVESLQFSESEADAFKQKLERLEKETHYNVFELTKLVLASFDEKLFVRTEAYEEAKEKLNKNGIVVLKGNPGEGKTTMSKMLARDLGSDKKVVNVSTRSDWRKVDLTDDTIIIIDDIFGASVLDVNEFKKWQNVISEIEKAVQIPDSKLRVIVTSRNYILNEAILRMNHSAFFTDENTVHISSEQLSDEEKKQILTNHLENYKRVVPQDFDVQKCIKCSNTDSDGNILFPIGFPECANLFSQKDELFNERYEFFQKPMYFIKEHTKTVFEEDTILFFAYFLIWAQKNHELHIEDIEMPIEDTPDYVKTVLGKLQCSPAQHLSQIGRRLKEHKDGFLSFDESKGLYTFSHRVIADVVGLVAFDKNETLVLSCCDFDFAMRYIRLQKTLSDTLYVAPYRFTCLSRALVEFVKIEGGQLDGTVIQHEAFRIKEFCQIFIGTLQSRFGNDILSVPVQSLIAFFMQSEIELKHEESRLASFSLYKGNGKSVFAKQCFKKSLVPKYVLEEELYMSGMIAIKFGSIESLEWLFQRGAKVADEMVILAARENNNDIIEFLRQELDNGKCDVSRGWNRANKPNPMVWLIQNHKTAAVDILAGRHKNFKDLKISNTYSTALHVACYYGETEIAEMIIAKYPKLDKENEQGYYPIQIAVKKGHTETVMSLLTADNARKTLTLANKDNIKELTLFHIAIWRDDDILAEKLAETGYFTNKVDAFHRTAMMFALNGEKHRCIKKLLEFANIDKETPDKDGNTPLHKAIIKAKRDDRYVQYAKDLSKKVDINKQNNDGNTPLHLAFARKQPAIQNELLENPKIKKDIVNKNNKTPSQLLEPNNPDSEMSNEENGN